MLAVYLRGIAEILEGVDSYVWRQFLSKIGYLLTMTVSDSFPTSTRAIPMALDPIQRYVFQVSPDGGKVLCSETFLIKIYNSLVCVTPLPEWPLFGKLKRSLAEKKVVHRNSEESEEGRIRTLDKPFVGDADTGCSVFRIDMAIGDMGNAAGCLADLRQCIGIVIQKENLDAIPVAGNRDCTANANPAFFNVEVEPFVFWLPERPFDIFQQSRTAFKPG